MNLDARASAVDYDPFSGGALRRVVPTTEPQREVWLGDRLGTDASLSFNLSLSLRLRGRLDLKALRVALQALVDRHEALRASFGPDGETMCVMEQVDSELALVDLGASSGGERDAAIGERLRASVETPFSLGKGNLFRSELLRLDEAEHLLVLTAHHIVCDGWSWGVLVRELGLLYSQAAGFASDPLPEAESFAEYALRQAEPPADSGHAADENYWLSVFPGTPPVLDLPTDRPRPVQRTFASRRADHLLDAELLAAVRRMGARRGASLFATLLAGFSALLSRLSGEATVVVGIPAAGQALDGHQGLVGHCVNLLPLRFDMDPAQTFADAIDASQATLLDALDHQRYTFGTLLKKLPIARDPGRMPLVSAVLNLERDMEQDAACFAGLSVEVASDPRSSDTFELFVNAVLAHGALRLECQYNCDLFDADTIRRWMLAYETLLRSAVEQCGLPVASLSLLDASALDELAGLQPPSVPFQRNLRMHEWFEVQCDRTPERIALGCGSTTMTYAAMEGRANRIAHLLRARGIGRGSLVGLAVDREPDMLAALLGVLKAGAGYVPLDPHFPADRLTYMAADAGLAALITHQAHAAAFDLGGRPMLVLDQLEAELAAAAATRLGNDDDGALPESVAYVIYTSGSTGRPKGVQVPHRAVANFLAAMAGETGLGRDDRLVAVTTLSFDIAVLELLLPLSVGAMVVLATRGIAGDGAGLMSLLTKSRATAMQATPATWRLLLEAGWQGRHGFKILCGGETLPADLAAQLLSRGSGMWNLYGPTETTVWSTCARIPAPAPKQLPNIHIGRPIANTRIWILDPRGELLPIGVPGEICIGGDGVSLGYLHRPELTAERFIADRLSAPERLAPAETARPALLYRTGDRGRWRTDGNLEHLGRLDSQVKIRGFRIELGEIEAQALAIPSITRAVATVRELGPGDARLMLHIVSSEPLDEDEVQARLRGMLPDYMIPQHVLRLEAIPLLPNGKVDRAALPTPALRPARSDELPRNALERSIATAMEEILGVPSIGIHDDFFASGGHSLLAAQLITRLNKQLDLALSWRALFDAPTVARLALAIGAAHKDLGASAGASIPRRADQSWAPLTVAQDRLRQLEEFSPGRSTYNLPSAHRLRGKLDYGALEQALSALIRRQTVLRTVIGQRDGRAVQVVLDDVAPAFSPVIDLSGLPGAEREAELQRRLTEMSEQSLDLVESPPFRMALFRLDSESHVLFFLAHHILWDGWSFDLMVEEMAELYAACREGRTANLPGLPVTFGDYSAWHNQWLLGPEYAAQREFWRKRLVASRVAPALPRDKPGTPGMPGHGRTLSVAIPRETVEALRKNALQQESTLFMTLLAAYFVLLHHASGHVDLVVGTPVRGRNGADVEGLMGFFTALLPLHLSMDAGWSFSELVRRVRPVVVDGFAHPDILLEDLQVDPIGRRGQRGQGLYHAMLSYQDGRRRSQRWGDLTRERIALFSRGTAEDLGLWFLEDDEGLQGELLYNDDALSEMTATRLQSHLQEILRWVAADPSASIGSLGRAVEEDHVSTHSEAAATDRAEPRAVCASLADGQACASRIMDPRERLLAAIFSQLFGIDDIRAEDNFFELGGTSLLALRLVKRVEQSTGVRLNLIRLATGTVGSLARELPMEAGHSSGRRTEPLWRRLFGRSST